MNVPIGPIEAYFKAFRKLPHDFIAHLVFGMEYVLISP